MRRSMRRKNIALLVSLLMAFVFLPVMAIAPGLSAYEAYMSGEFEIILSGEHDSYIPHLREVVSTLALRNRNNDGGMSLIDAWDLFIEASYVMNESRAFQGEVSRIISGIAEPCIFNDKFTVGFIDEKHLELIDLVSELTGIPEDMLNPMVWGTFYLDPSIGQPVDLGFIR